MAYGALYVHTYSKHRFILVLYAGLIHAYIVPVKPKLKGRSKKSLHEKVHK